MELKRAFRPNLSSLFAFFILTTSSATTLNPAFAADIKHLYVKYTVAFAGVPIGKIRVYGDFNGQSYKLTAAGRTAGVSRLFSDGKGSLASTGKIQNSYLQPNWYNMQVVDEKEVSTAEMTITSRKIGSLKAKPALSKRDDRVNVTAAHQKGVIDPLSAFLIPVRRSAPTSGEDACNRTLPIFDGWKRYDIQLFYKGKKNFNANRKRGYKGPVFVCGIRYKPVAGHRSQKKEVIYMQKNKNMELWVAAVKDTKFVVPVYLKVGTKFGPLSLKSTILETKN